MNLSDTHLIILSAAAQRADGLLSRPDRLAGNAVEKLAARLVRLGAAEEVRVGPDQPFWSEDNGERVGLKITAAGLAAIGLDVREDDPPLTDATIPTASVARAGTKKARVLELLGRADGTSLDDLIEATGWLPHTTRAVLTGLRKAGHELVKEKNAAGRTIYRLGALRPAAE